jgi:hypothetical protein
VLLWLRCPIPQGHLTGFPVAIQSSRMTSVSPRDIPGSHQIGMQRVLALAAHKEQALPGSVLAAGVATARTGLVALVGIHLDAELTDEQRLIGEQSVQRGFGPLARMPVCAALLL